MELEKIATNAVETSIVKTDRLTSFISRGDKEPCWDGNIYIHESKNHNKRNIKKVSTQIKGKAVTPDQVGNTIKYRISHDDLTAYMMNGGTMFFVVYINKETGEPLQIYYTQLLPIKIKEILKKDLKSYDVWFNKFPENNSEKTAIFVQFHSDAQRQASFAGMELPSIDDLTKRGVLESLTFQCTGYGDYRALSSVPRIMDGKPLSIYANIKGYSCPVPVKYIESIHQVTMSAHESSPITVNGIQYYDGFQKVTTAEKMELHIGSCVRVTCPNSVDENHSAPITLNLKICGMLKQRIIGIEFIIAMLTCKKFCIGEYELPVEIPDTERKVIEDSNLSETLASYKRVQALLYWRGAQSLALHTFQNRSDLSRNIPALKCPGFFSCSDIEAVVGLVAIQAQFPAVRDANPVCTCRFTTAFADVGIKQARPFRKLDGRFLHVEHFAGFTGLIIGEGLLAGHLPVSGLENQAHGFSVLPVVKGERLLAAHMEQEVALAHAAAQNHLYGVHAAGVVFCDADHLLILRETQIQQLNGIQRRLVADGQATAHMPVECGALFPQYLVFIHDDCSILFFICQKVRLPFAQFSYQRACRFPRAPASVPERSSGRCG